MAVMKHPGKTGCLSFQLSMNSAPVGTSRCDVPVRATADRTLMPLDAARTAQRTVPAFWFKPRL